MDALRNLSCLASIILVVLIVLKVPVASAVQEKVVLFIATNSNSEDNDNKGAYGEILAARMAVAERNRQNPSGPREVLVAMTEDGVHRYDSDSMKSYSGSVDQRDRGFKKGPRTTVMNFVKRDPEVQRKVDAIEVKIQSLRGQIEAQNTNSPGYQEMENRYRALIQQQSDIAGPGGVNQESLREVLDLLKSKGPGQTRADGSCKSSGGVEVSSMIVSGHHADGQYSGTAGGMNQKQIGDTFQDFPCIKKGVKSLILPACYSGVLGNCSAEWQDFENHEFTFAYDGLAPLADRRAGQDYIFNALEAEERLREKAEAYREADLNHEVLQPYIDDIEEQMRKIASGGIASLASICLGGGKYMDDPEFESMHYRNQSIMQDKDGNAILDLRKKCPELFEGLTNGIVKGSGGQKTIDLESYREYFRGDRSLPISTRLDSPLRQYYGRINNFLNCANIVNKETGRPYSEGDVIPSAHEAIALIHFKKVLRNFLAAYGEDLEDNLVDLQGLLEMDREFIDVLKNKDYEPNYDEATVLEFVEEHRKLEEAIGQLTRLSRGEASRKDVVQATKNLEAWFDGRRPDRSDRPGLRLADYDLAYLGKIKKESGKTGGDNPYLNRRGNQYLVENIAMSLADNIVDFDPGCFSSQWINEPRQDSGGSDIGVPSRCSKRTRLGARARQLDNGQYIANHPESEKLDLKLEVADWIGADHQAQIDEWAQAGETNDPVELGQRVLASLRAAKARKAAAYYAARKKQLDNKLYWGEEDYTWFIENGRFSVDYDELVTQARADFEARDERLYEVLANNRFAETGLPRETQEWVAKKLLENNGEFERRLGALRKLSGRSKLNPQIEAIVSDRWDAETALQNYIRALGGDPSIPLASAARKVVSEVKTRDESMAKAIRAALTESMAGAGSSASGEAATAVSTDKGAGDQALTRENVVKCRNAKPGESGLCDAVRDMIVNGG